LPKTVTRQRRDCDLNPGPSAPESSTLTTRLPSHPKSASLLCWQKMQFTRSKLFPCYISLHRSELGDYRSVSFPAAADRLTFVCTRLSISGAGTCGIIWTTRRGRDKHGSEDRRIIALMCLLHTYWAGATGTRNAAMPVILIVCIWRITITIEPTASVPWWVTPVSLWRHSTNNIIATAAAATELAAVCAIGAIEVVGTRIESAEGASVAEGPLVTFRTTHSHSRCESWRNRSYSITERRVPQLIPILGSQSAGNVSHKPGGIGCRYFLPDLQLPSQPLRGLLPISLLGEQRHDWCEQFA